MKITVKWKTGLTYDLEILEVRLQSWLKHFSKIEHIESITHDGKVLSYVDKNKKYITN
jgi:hypothetical protein